MVFSLSSFAPEKLVSRKRFGYIQSRSYFSTDTTRRLNLVTHHDVTWTSCIDFSPSPSSLDGFNLLILILCVCVCVFFPFILDIKFVGRTSRGRTGGRSHRISHPPSFCGACLNFSREKDSAIPFPRRP